MILLHPREELLAVLSRRHVGSARRPHSNGTSRFFFNQPLVVAPDESHSAAETRFFVLGRTDAHRLLFVVFTPRKNLVRIVSARDMSRAEREAYRSHEEENPEV